MLSGCVYGALGRNIHCPNNLFLAPHTLQILDVARRATVNILPGQDECIPVEACMGSDRLVLSLDGGFHIAEDE